ncbi:MAG: hypothetical protein ACYC8T_24595, partial [Myxococcaceae bacterium]
MLRLLAKSRWALPALGLALCGCQTMRVHATVSASREPLAGAAVSMDCPQAIKASGPSLLGRTDANGELDFTEGAGGRWIHDSCELIVEQPGFQTARFPVAAVCKEYSANHC